MITLVLAILANVAIFTAFRLMPRLGAVTFHAIVVNYWVCVVTGLLFVGNNPAWEEVSWQAPWVPWMAVLCIIFIVTFLLMARTTQEFSMSVATIANKMSLAVPVLFSLLVLGGQAKAYDVWNYLGIGLAFPAIALSSWGKKTKTDVPRNLSLLLMPFGVFFLGGLIDSLLNYVNLTFISAAFSPVFTIVLFIGTGVLGLLVLILRRQLPSRRSILAGVILGVPNYFSIYFVLKGLGEFNNDGALFFPILNLGIILGSALVGVLAFREIPTRVKALGLALSLVALVLISYQELF